MYFVQNIQELGLIPLNLPNAGIVIWKRKVKNEKNKSK